MNFKTQYTVVFFGALLFWLLLALALDAAAEWRVAPNADAVDRPAYWVADINGIRVEAILNDYRVTVGTPCLGAEVRPAGAYSLRWLDVGPNPLAGICRWVDTGEPTEPTQPALRDMVVTWEHNGLRTDGTPAALTGFIIHLTHDGAEQPSVTVADGAARSHTLSDLATGEWCVTVTALEGDLESTPSTPPVCQVLQ